MIDEDMAIRYGMALESSRAGNAHALSNFMDIVREAAIEECAKWIEQHGSADTIGNNNTANGLRTLKEQSNG